MKDPWVKKPKAKFSESKALIPQRFKDKGNCKKTWKKKEKQEKYYRKRRPQDSTLANRVNAFNTLEGILSIRTHKNFIQITYYK